VISKAEKGRRDYLHDQLKAATFSAMESSHKGVLKRAQLSPETGKKFPLLPIN
jgi:hypothetical protein